MRTDDDAQALKLQAAQLRSQLESDAALSDEERAALAAALGRVHARLAAGGKSAPAARGRAR